MNAKVRASELDGAPSTFFRNGASVQVIHKYVSLLEYMGGVLR